MIVKVLSENTSVSEKLGSEHGLSLYIETENHRLLFDTGASELFAENAEKLGIDLAKVDLVVISHGHYDHGGGLQTFLNINSKAKIYLNQKAFEKHYSIRPGGIKADIGLDEALLPNKRFVFCADYFVIDGELELFSGVQSARLAPSGNAGLLMKIGDTYVQDDFAHEQNLIIRKSGKTMLVAGCAHSGIINIVEHFISENGCPPDYVIGGFHLYNHRTNLSETSEAVDEIAKLLFETHAHYYTCHCTGVEPYNRLKTVMGENIDYISTGSQITINI